MRSRASASRHKAQCRQSLHRTCLQAKARAAPVCLPPARSFVQRGRAGLQGECFGLDRAATQRPGLAQKAERGRAVGLDEIVAVTTVQAVVISASGVAVEGAAVAGRATESPTWTRRTRLPSFVA
jgi:hypothetical protein